MMGFRAGLLSQRERDALRTRGGLNIVRMSQDTTFHLASPQDVGAWETKTFCGVGIMAEVYVYHPSIMAEVPLYRGRNEFSKCTQCDQRARVYL